MLCLLLIKTNDKHYLCIEKQMINIIKTSTTMTTTINFRSVVFKRAYLIVKKTGCTLSAALVEAWKRYREYKERIVKEIADNINGFDFYYHYSDDGRVYRYWSNIKEEITNQLSTLPNFFIAAIANLLDNQKNIKSFI